MLIRRNVNKNYLLHTLVSALLLVGCAGSAHVQGSASMNAPDLVYVSPGVQVIANYREPIFYSDNYYWRYSGDVWYRSSVHTRGWVRYQAPTAVLRIERPSAYVYYRGSARANAAAAQPHSTPGMTHDERKEVKEAPKEERKELKEAQKEERKELKHDQKEAKQDQKDAKHDRK